MTIADGKTKLWIGFASSLSSALLTLLLVLISFLVSASEPTWPGQPIGVYGTARWISNLLTVVAWWLLIGTALVSGSTIHRIAERDRKRMSATAILLTVLSALLIATYATAQRIYLPLAIAQDPTNYARAILAAPRLVGWLLENGFAVVGVAAVLLGSALVSFGAALQRDQLQRLARWLLVFTGSMCILAGLSLPLGLMFIAWPLYAAMVLAFIASNVALSVMFLHMRHQY